MIARRSQLIDMGVVLWIGAWLAGCETVTSVVVQEEDGSFEDVTPEDTVNADQCRGTIGAVSVELVNVPSGATCVLDGTRVSGSVVIQQGATLQARRATVAGSIQGDDAHAISISDGTVVGGSIQLKRRVAAVITDTSVDGDLQVEGSGASLIALGSRVGGNLQVKKAGSAQIDRTIVDGNLQLEDNSGALGAADNRVGANLQVFKNTGGVSLVTNRVAQDLQCRNNRPAPVGGGNIADEKEGQCSRL